jgi:hypothetical protein
MLPVYHRQQDTKLLLLTVPACTMLWAEGGLTGWLAVLVTSISLVLTGDIPWAILLGLSNKLHIQAGGIVGKLLLGAELFSVPLILLTVGIFYLVVYVKRCSASPAPSPQ